MADFLPESGLLQRQYVTDIDLNGGVGHYYGNYTLQLDVEEQTPEETVRERRFILRSM
jgi:hypothetical protein